MFVTWCFKKKNVLHIPTTKKIADVLTKPLSATNFQKFKQKITMVDVVALGLQAGVKAAH